MSKQNSIINDWGNSVPLGKTGASIFSKDFLYVINKDQLQPERVALFKAAERFLRQRKWQPALRALARGLPQSAHIPGALLSMILFGDCFDFTIKPAMFANSKLDSRIRFLAILSMQPDFVLAYMTKLRYVASQPDKESRAIVAIRKYGRLEKNSVVSTYERLKEDTVKKARKKLSKMDAELTSAFSIQKGKTIAGKSPRKSRLR